MSFYGGGYYINKTLSSICQLNPEFLKNPLYFENNLKDLQNILNYPHYSGVYVPVNYPVFYQETLDVLVNAKLTGDQLKKIYNVFKEHKLYDDKRKIRVLRLFRCLDPNQNLHQIVMNLHKNNMWKNLSSQLPELFPNHHGEIVQAYQNSLESFSFEEMKNAQNKDKVFNRKLNHLQRVFEYRATNKIEKFDEKITKQLVEVELTGPQEDKLNALIDDKIKLLRQIFHYNPQKKGELKKIALNLQKNGYWESIEPQLKELSPQYHQQIREAYLDSIKPLNTRFRETLANIGGFKKFKDEYENDPGYRKLDWDDLYKLIKEQSHLWPKATRMQIIDVYVKAANPEDLKTAILVQYFDSGRKSDLCFKKQFEASRFYYLDENGQKEIAELCSHVGLNQNEEQACWDLFSGKSRDHFLLERFKCYCRYIKDKDYNISMYWNLEAFKAFFGSICYKLYYNQIQESTFREIIECVSHQLTQEEQKAILSAREFTSCKAVNHYHCCFVMAECKKLKTLEMQGSESSTLLKSIQENLKDLVKKHVTSTIIYAREVSYGQILSVFSSIQSLNLSEALYRPILEIFKEAGSPTETDRTDWYGVDTSLNTGKGEIVDFFLHSIQTWFNENKEWLEMESQEDKRSPGLLKKVKELLKLLKGDNPSLTFWNVFRDALSDKMFLMGYERLLTLGAKEAGISVMILNEMHKKMNVFPSFVKMMKEVLPLGLLDLAKSKRQISYLAERELLKFSDPLQLPLELQNEAIEGLNEGCKTPLFNLLQGIPFKYLSATYINADGGENNVDLFRMPSLVNMGRSLLISLDDTKSNSSHAFTANFSTKGAFYHQENEYATPSLHYVTFKSQTIEQVIKMLPEAWLADEMFKNSLETCMDQVKAILYPNESSLDPTQRRNCIKLYYLRLAFFLISYTNVSSFGFTSNGQELYNSLMVKLLTALSNNKDSKPQSYDFTYEEMEKVLLCGAKLSHPNELQEIHEILNAPEVQVRLRQQNPFLNQKIEYSDFKVPQLNFKESMLLENSCRALSLTNNATYSSQ